MWSGQHLKQRLHNINSESVLSTDAFQKLLKELGFRLSDDILIEAHSHIFCTLYYRVIVKCLLFLLAHLPFQQQCDFKFVLPALWEIH